MLGPEAEDNALLLILVAGIDMRGDARQGGGTRAFNAARGSRVFGRGGEAGERIALAPKLASPPSPYQAVTSTVTSCGLLCMLVILAHLVRKLGRQHAPAQQFLPLAADEGGGGGAHHAAAWAGAVSAGGRSGWSRLSEPPEPASDVAADTPDMRFATGEKLERVAAAAPT